MSRSVFSSAASATKALFRRRENPTADPKPPPRPPAYLSLRSSTLFILTTICLAIFTDILLYGLIVPVIPFSLTAQAGVPADQVQHWTAVLLACYNAALVVGSPLAGLYADRTESRRWPLLLGLLALASSTLLLCLGKSVALLAVGRVLQGVSAAVVWSVGLALLVDTVGREIGYAMGYVNIAMAVGLLISPVLGGAVYARAGYYAVFYIAFAVICCDIALRVVLVEKKVARKWLDDAVDGGSGSGSGSGSGEDGRAVEGTPAAPDGGATGAASDQPGPEPSGMQKQDKTKTPATPSSPSPRPAPAAMKRHPVLELIMNRRILAMLVAVVIEATIAFAFDTIVPLYVKDTFNWDSTAAGLIFIGVMIPGFASPLIGKLSDRYGARWLSMAGFVLSIPPLVCMRLVTRDTLGHKVLLCALLSILGGTLITVVTTPLMAEMTYAIEEREAEQPGIWGERGVYGFAYGLWTTAFALGGTIGSIMAGYLEAGPGWGTTTWVLAVWAAVGALVCLGLGSKPNKAVPNADASLICLTTVESSRPSRDVEEQPTQS